MYTSRKYAFLRRVLIVAGAVLLAAGAVSASGGSSAKRGGTLRISYTAYSIDPASEFPTLTLLGATQLTLLAFPDRGGTRIVPEAAALPTVSADGRTYTFTIRQGFRFSDGSPVSAADFAAAFRRIFDPRLQSFSHHRLLPSYIAGLFEDVVGARAFMQGKAKSVSGVKAKGDKLVIRLLSPRPDLLARLAVPYVTAVPVDLPVVEGGVRTPFPSAGPYVVSEFTSDRSFVLVRNRYWRRDLLPWRPANVDRIVSVSVSAKESVRAVEEDKVDFNGVPDDQLPALVAKYGVNKGRLLVLPEALVSAIGFNLDRPLFKGNPKLRQAVNYALDRAALVHQHGLLAASPTDQNLFPGFPGFHDWHLYPLKGPNLSKARALAKGNLRGGKAVMYTYAPSASHPFGLGVAQVVKRDLARIGLTVEIKQIEATTMYEKAAKRGEPWDLIYTAWAPDYADPYDILNLQFERQYIRYGIYEMTNWTRFRDPVFNRRLRAVAKLSGKARFQAYAVLERDLMREAAPIAPYALRNAVLLVSPSLGCFTWNPLGFENWVAMCKK